MVELAEMIRRHYEAAADPVSLEEVFGRVESRADDLALQPGAEPRVVVPSGRRLRVSGAFAAAAMFLSIAGGAWVLTLVSGSDGVTTVDFPAADDEVLPNSLPEFDLGTGEWTVTRGSIGAREGSEINDAVALPSVGFFAVGGDGGEAQVWFSTGGRAWRAIEEVRVGGGVEMQFSDPAGVLMNSVVVGGPGFVAVGGHMGVHDVIDDDERCTAGEVAFCDEEAVIVPAIGGASAWTSVDGFEWSRVHHDSSSGGAMMTAVAAGGPGFVAVGWAAVPPSEQNWDDHWISSEAGDGAVWTSVDGTKWERVPDVNNTFEGGRLFDIILGPDGLIAVGTKVWASHNGVDWTLVDDLPGSPYELGEDRAGLGSVARGGPGFVGVGWGGSVWTSVDGSGWDRVPELGDTFGGAHIQSVAGGTEGLVAAVESSFAGEGGLWISADGYSWSPVEAGALATVDGANAIILDGNAFLALGSSEFAESGGPVDDVAAAWFVSPSPPASPPSSEEAFVVGMEAVNAMLEAYNRGDADGWTAFFANPETLGAGGSTLDVELLTLAAQGTWVIDGECVPRSSVQLECLTVRRDEFHGPGGLELHIPYRFTFGEENIIFYEAGGDPGPEGDWFDAYYDFSERFLDWLETAYPSAASTADFGPSGIEVMLSFVDEFVAQSEIYPLDSVG